MSTLGSGSTLMYMISEGVVQLVDFNHICMDNRYNIGVW